MKVRLKDENDIKLMRVSGKILAHTIAELVIASKEGVQLSVLDALARKLISEAGATPTFLGYTPEGATKPYPVALCASVNAQIVHGIPGNYILKSGDLFSIDLGVTYKGRITDSAVTIGIGKISDEAKLLMRTTELSLERAIKECVPGKHLGDIGYVIGNTAKNANFRVIQGLTGHGVGFELHEDPSVFNYGTRGEGLKLVPGLVIAIEPMFSVGSQYAVAMRDGSYETKDGSLSAHFEHTIAITEHGHEVLTER
ncbi:MAG: type I methionyl aminopeptidase [Patescibacteria group bacterium]